jgi:1-acyl-sn-glycerol-3-phosphate acyltransferase
MKYLRAGFRFLSALTLFLLAYLHFIFLIKLRGRASSLEVRTKWLQFWAKNLVEILRVDVKWEGTPPSRGLMVSNHLGYVDVLVYGAICPLIFLSKSEVSKWPIAGPLTRCAGTLYIRRQNKTDVKRLGADMEPVVNAGMVVVLFLEGTSSDGSQVLPFRSSLLAPVEEHGWPVTPAWIHYTLPDGAKAEHVAYWGDATFLTHFLNLITQKRVQAHAHFGTPVTVKSSRKELAQELHAQVCRLKENYEAKEKGERVLAK